MRAKPETFLSVFNSQLQLVDSIAAILQGADEAMIANQMAGADDHQVIRIGMQKALDLG